MSAPHSSRRWGLGVHSMSFPALSMQRRRRNLFVPLASCCAGSYWVPWVAHMTSIVSVVYNIDCTTGAISTFTGRRSGAAAERQSSRACIYYFVGRGGRSLRAPLSVTCERCRHGSDGKAGVCCRPWQRLSAGRRQRRQRETHFRLSGGGPAGTRWARQAGAAAGLPSSRRGQ